MAGCLLCLALAAAADDEDVYQDSAAKRMQVPEEAAESELRLPAYPDAGNSIEISLDRRDAPFSVLVDPASISIENHRDVRYTVILKSGTGAMNVFYESVRCGTSQYRRFAYGSDGSFRLLPDSDWKYVRAPGADRYRVTLMRDYLCPLPTGNGVKTLIDRLHQSDRASIFGTAQ